MLIPPIFKSSVFSIKQPDNLCRMKKIFNLSFTLFCCCCLTASAQNIKHSLKGTIAAMDTLHSRLPAEKLYLQLDKPYYAIGDTLRFKAYLLDDALFGSVKSGLLYVEMISDSNRVVKRQTIKVYGGIARGDIIIKKSWYAGSYALRGYTNWMRNFGQEHFFTRQLNIIPAGNQSWLVNTRLTYDVNKKMNVDLQFADHDHKNIGFKEMRLTVLQGTHTLVKNNTRTGAQGTAGITFPIPENADGLSVLAEDISAEGKGRKVIIPIALNRPENIDLQFMPEGGSLIAGVTSRMGFKALNEDGLGVSIVGKVLDGKQQAVADLKSVHKGMGAFEFIPKSGETYSAKVVLADGTSKIYPLPVVISSGITLRVNSKNNDSLDVILSAAPDLLTASATYYLVGQARDRVCYGAGVVFKDKTTVKVVAKNIFPTGITKWVLFDVSGKPVAQRLVFVDHDDRLNISLKTDKEVYSLRDSIGLQLAVTDAAGKPVSGSFSMAVTDDNLVKPFDTDAENIASYMLLNADLKGNIEDPGYYFNKENADRSAMLDVLLLTQGWAGYDWSGLFDLKPPKYEAETEFTVKGIATNIFNKGLANTDILLISKKPEIFMRTKTDSTGRFVFKGFPVLDTIDFHLQADRNYNVGLAVDEFGPSAFKQAKRIATPWYVNTDSSLVNYVNKKQAEEDEILSATKGKLLKTVEIKANKEPYNSFDKPVLILNEEEIRNTRLEKRPLSLMELLNYKENIAQMIKSVSVDGTSISVGPIYEPGAMAQINSWLSNFDSDNVKSVFVMRARGLKPHPKRIDDYPPPNTRFGIIPPKRPPEDVILDKCVTCKVEFIYLIISVTTKTGSGGFLMGGTVFRPMPISWPHQFYSPRYKVNTPVTGRDRRSTVYWSPDIETGEDGKAAGSFFSADRPGTYTLIMEGTDLNGNVGYSRKKIAVK